LGTLLYKNSRQGNFIIETLSLHGTKRNHATSKMPDKKILQQVQAAGASKTTVFDALSTATENPRFRGLKMLHLTYHNHLHL
jgi:hypothetical protein